jgi:transcriptional regulator with XRE-family HTH domain
MKLLEIGQRIRRQRETLGYTREKFAEILNITPRFCADIELGVKGMSLSTLVRVCQKLHVPADYILFGLENAPEPDPIMLMLKTCDPNLQPHITSLIKAFILAVEVNSGK